MELASKRGNPSIIWCSRIRTIQRSKELNQTNLREKLVGRIIQNKASHLTPNDASELDTLLWQTRLFKDDGFLNGITDCAAN